MLRIVPKVFCSKKLKASGGNGRVTSDRVADQLNQSDVAGFDSIQLNKSEAGTEGLSIEGSKIKCTRRNAARAPLAPDPHDCLA